ncbi:MAG: HAD family phosphatase [Acidimicrobiia bacterium]|nr:HAD family phosphatase [Acidimicrobiia bacterium]MYE73578.1 HAD family phosphatase [Acidimicrobiia bacterium]MYJ62325.1 HAD family phosphatase [Acidimicrobiia bacterium]
MIEAVFWDFGGVFTGSPFHHLDNYARSMGTTNERLLEHVFGRYEADGDHPWHRLERGEGTLADALEAAAEACRTDGIEGFNSEGFFKAMSGTNSDERRESAVSKVRELNEAGIRQAIITNNAKEFGDMWRSLIPVDELFDAVIDSSAVGMRKPDPRIYQLALDQLGVSSPETSSFLDDFEPNVAAARKLGMHGILVEHDISGALAELDRVIASN